MLCPISAFGLLFIYFMRNQTFATVGRSRYVQWEESHENLPNSSPGSPRDIFKWSFGELKFGISFTFGGPPNSNHRFLDFWRPSICHANFVGTLKMGTRRFWKSTPWRKPAERCNARIRVASACKRVPVERSESPDFGWSHNTNMSQWVQSSQVKFQC